MHDSPETSPAAAGPAEGPDRRRFAPAAARNREPILAVLRDVLPRTGLVLEVASGTGEHARAFALALAPLRWQPSDPDPAARASIEAWRAGGPAGLLAPLALDAAADAALWPLAAADAVVSINMIHVAPPEAGRGLLAGAARLLPPGGPLVLYGPFREGGRHTAPSNAAFDAALRARDPEWGVRDLDTVAADAARHGLRLDRVTRMPANNLTVVFRR